MLPSGRRYKSKAQRPCDFCRQRRAACRIVGAAPCELCKAYRRECTFLQAPPPRRRGTRASLDIARPGVSAGSGGGHGAGGDWSGTSTTDEDQVELVNASPDLRVEFEPLHSAHRQQQHEHQVQLPQALNLMTHAGSNDAIADHANLEHGFDNYDFEPLYDLLAAAEGDYLHSSGGLQAFVPVEQPREHSGTGENVAGAATAQPAANATPARLWPGSPTAIADVDNGILIGPTDPMDPYVMRQYHFDERGQLPFKRLTVRSVVGGAHPVQFLIFHSRSKELELEQDRLRTELDSIVPPDVGSRLLLLYYRFVSPQFPVLPIDPPATVTELSPDVLAAVYLLVIDYSTFDDVLCIQTVYEPQQRSAELRVLLLASLSTQERHPTLSSLQAALLLALAPPADYLTPENEQASALASMVAAMANALGLQHDPSDWNLAPGDKALRRRLSSLVLAGDAWCAAVTGRPPLLGMENWLVDHVGVEDLVAGGDGAGGLEVMREMRELVRFVDLSRILRQVLRDLFSLQAARRLSTDLAETLAIAQPLMQQLSDWRSMACDTNIDSSGAAIHDAVDSNIMLGVDGGGGNSAKNNGTSTSCGNKSMLMLGYHGTRTILFRAILRPLHNNSDGTNAGQEQARKGAMACARAFTAYIEGLTLDDFQSFWPFWSVACFALHSQLWLTLLLSAPTVAEAAECFGWISRVRRVLRTRARSFAPLRLALLRADSVWWRGLDSTIRLRPAVAEGIKLAGGNSSGGSVAGGLERQI